MYRNTYVEINLQNIEKNVKKIIKKYSDYEYFFQIVDKVYKNFVNNLFFFIILY